MSFCINVVSLMRKISLCHSRQPVNLGCTPRSSTFGGSGGILRRWTNSEDPRQTSPATRMTTRSGTQYKEPEMSTEGGGASAMAEVLRMIHDAEERRERAAAEEREWLREAEERRAQAAAEERARRQEEHATSLRAMQLQMEALRDLVERSQQQEEEQARRGNGGEVKLTRLGESDDIEAYLTTFERLMQVGRIDEGEWVLRLAPQLMGKAQQAHVAMSSADGLRQGEGSYTVPMRYQQGNLSAAVLFNEKEGGRGLRGVSGAAAGPAS